MFHVSLDEQRSRTQLFSIVSSKEWGSQGQVVSDAGGKLLMGCEVNCSAAQYLSFPFCSKEEQLIFARAKGKINII